MRRQVPRAGLRRPTGSVPSAGPCRGCWGRSTASVRATHGQGDQTHISGDFPSTGANFRLLFEHQCEFPGFSPAQGRISASNQRCIFRITSELLLFLPLATLAGPKTSPNSSEFPPASQKSVAWQPFAAPRGSRDGAFLHHSGDTDATLLSPKRDACVAKTRQFRA